ncbi:MAG: galactokinase [Pseudomonadota bacterium]|uniref:galactokinase n=1 Tax=Thermithiobacillus tepidarius TaxID=929 RepID=UPI00040B5926|nr:galactokinase [Thermithiobacillus tepidarius]
MKSFEEIFGIPPEARADAPGRVNLLGEHTDYNDGFVLPTAIPQRTHVQASRSPDNRHHFYAARLDELIGAAPDGPAPQGFASYVFGCIRLLQARGHPLGPVLLHIDSQVPMGAGLSSSAALEVATLRALRALFALSLDDVIIAQVAQQAEIEYAHVRCGIMDQMAASLADTEHMLFLDTRTLERRVLPLPDQAEIVVIDSGVPRTLAGSMYNQRRAECEEAARRLGVAALRDVGDPAQAERLPEPLRRRARHVISENRRVLEAAGGVSAARFGELMNASHASLRDDYEVSVVALDTLVALLQQDPATYGARLTGAGFGGACVALVKRGEGKGVAERILAQYNRQHGGRVLVPTA